MRPYVARFLSAFVTWGWFGDEGIKWLHWVSKRWYSSFEVDHHHLSSPWMRPRVARLLSAFVTWGWFGGWRDKVISASQEKMTLFIWSRSSSSFVALNATSGGSVFVHISYMGLLRGEWTDKVISESQQKMTFFIWSRLSSSFVALNATLCG